MRRATEEHKRVTGTHRTRRILAAGMHIELASGSSNLKRDEEVGDISSVLRGDNQERGLTHLSLMSCRGWLSWLGFQVDTRPSVEAVRSDGALSVPEKENTKTFDEPDSRDGTELSEQQQQQ